MRELKGDSSGGTAASIAFRVIFIVLIVAFLILPQAQPYREDFYEYLKAGLYKYQEVPDKVDFSVERILTIESDGELEYTLYLPIPQDLEIDGMEAQTLSQVEFSKPGPVTGEGVEEKQWIWHNTLKSEKHEIAIVYHFKNAKIEWDISITKSGKIRDIDDRYLSRWGGDQWPVDNYNDEEAVDSDMDGIEDIDDVDDDNDGNIDKYRIEPSNPTIQKLLKDILVERDLISSSTSISASEIGHLNVYRVVDAIYDYIDETCVYPNEQQMYDDSQRYGSYPKWSTGTLSDKRGDCDDQSILFISLCRAAGIPAMLEIGALYDPNMRVWEGHGWANVYIPYSTSYQSGKDIDHVTPMVDIVNDIFLFRDPNRFSEWVDDGVRGTLDPDTGEWTRSHLEDRYLAWEYTRGSSGGSVSIGEEYITLEYKAYPPEQKIYI